VSRCCAWIDSAPSSPRSRCREIFNSLHPPGTIEHNLPADAFKGYIDPEAAAKSAAAQRAEKEREKKARDALSPVETILGLDEFEVSQLRGRHLSELDPGSGSSGAQWEHG